MGRAHADPCAGRVVDLIGRRPVRHGPDAPAGDDVLHLWPMSRAVNSEWNNRADLLDRVDDQNVPPPSDAPSEAKAGSLGSCYPASFDAITSAISSAFPMKLIGPS